MSGRHAATPAEHEPASAEHARPGATHQTGWTALVAHLLCRGCRRRVDGRPG